MKSIIETTSDSPIDFEEQSKQRFCAFSPQNFLVLPDAKTIIGPDASNDKRLVSEDISTHEVTQLGHLSNVIRSVLFDAKTRSLFAADANGQLVQYEKSEEDGSFTLAKDYGCIGMGQAYASVLVGDLALFGGSHSVYAVRVSGRELLEGALETPFGQTLSLVTCRLSKSKVLLSVSGGYTSKLKSSTDIFEVQTQEPSCDLAESVLESSSTLKKEILKVSGLPLADQEKLAGILSSVFLYVEALLRNFTHRIEGQLLSAIGKEVESGRDSELTKKLQKIIRGFHSEDQGKIMVFIQIFFILIFRFAYQGRTEEDQSKCLRPSRYKDLVFESEEPRRSGLFKESWPHHFEGQETIPEEETEDHREIRQLSLPRLQARRLHP